MIPITFCRPFFWKFWRHWTSTTSPTKTGPSVPWSSQKRWFLSTNGTCNLLVEIDRLYVSYINICYIYIIGCWVCFLVNNMNGKIRCVFFCQTSELPWVVWRQQQKWPKLGVCVSLQICRSIWGFEGLSLVVKQHMKGEWAGERMWINWTIGTKIVFKWTLKV